jgi:hypothetical protein
MTDWIEHNGGPQPVADDVWVEVSQLYQADDRDLARWIAWDYKLRYRILNQHLIDAARREGIRLGLEAAKRAIEPLYEPQADDILQALNPKTIAKEAQHD